MESENITINKAASLMKKSPQFVRIGLQRGLLPFGTAIKMSSRYTYYISPKEFYEYIGKGNLYEEKISFEKEC